MLLSIETLGYVTLTWRFSSLAWVDMTRHAPVIGGKAITVPVDMSNHTITAWVYAPNGARGQTRRPNGFQIFVKDSDWRSQYGTWFNITEEDRWVLIKLAVGRRAVERDGANCDSLNNRESCLDVLFHLNFQSRL